MSGGNSSQAATLPQPCQPEQGLVIVGRYRLIEKLGEGGFGEVWLGEQREPVRRRVAVKIIKLGMDTRQVVARFEAERQALALMDHPNIAKVLDGGATEAGRPYFVMEVVKGVPITEYCATHRCSTEERLRLFVQVCRAIQHAHQKGIIHRDIKPSNVLVAMTDGEPSAKVIDFGIAKATQQELTDKTLVTHLQQFIGTPAYMSPEQAEMTGLDIDTRTDIYSLGVLLYELLTGATPFDSRKLLSAGIEEMRRIIREEYPVRPSTRLATTIKERPEAAVSPAERPEHLIGALRGDLDWIVMKCLEKDRTRRYETANGLGMDVERHLRKEPVAARPPSTVYRLRKTAARHRFAFASAAVVLLALIGAVVVSTWSALRARRAEQEQRALRTAAERSQQQAEAARLLAQRHLYAADMLLAFQADAEGNLGQVRRLAQKYAGPESAGLRGWEWRRLSRIAAGDPALILRGHTDDVPFSSFIPSHNRVATMSMDGFLRIFDAQTGAELERREAGRGRRGLAISPNGTIVAAAADRIQIWTAGERREIEIEPDWKVSKPCFSRNGKWFAFANSRALYLYTAPEFRQVKSVPRGEGPFGSFALGTAFTRDSGALIYPAKDRRLLLHQISDGRERSLGTTESEATSIAVSPDGLTVASADLSGILICRIEGPESARRLTEHRTQVVGVAFSPDGKTLASASGDQTVRLWDTATWTTKRVLRGHEHEVHSVEFSADGRLLLSSGKDQTARLWDLASLPPQDEARPVRWQPFDVQHAAAKQLLVQTDEGGLGALDLADLKTRPFAGSWPANISAFASVGAFEISATGFGSGAIEIWTGASPARATTLQAAGPLQQLALSEDGRWLAAWITDDSVELWNVREKQRVLILPRTSVNSEGWSNPVFAPGGKFLARVTAGRRTYNDITILDLETFETNTFASTHNGLITSIAFSPTDELLATSAFDGKLKIWNARTGREIATFLGQLVGYTAVCFSRDGSRLAAGGWDGTITLWDVASRQQVARWKAHRLNIRWLQFMDGDVALASAGQNKIEEQWEVALWRGGQ